MQVKEVKSINFLFFRTETYIHELASFFPVAGQLFSEAVNHKLTITGPIHWHYHGFMGDVSKPFILEVALPVGEVLTEYDGAFHFKRTEPFKCVSAVHEGNWLDLPASYGKLMEFMTANKLTPTAQNREIYVNSDFNYPEANTTEVQIGIL
jgi:hypothetical protein